MVRRHLEADHLRPKSAPRFPGEACTRAFARLPMLLPATEGVSVVDGFRAAVAGLRTEPGLSPDAVIVGAMPVIAAALVRKSRGEEMPIAPDATRGHAADIASP